MPVLELTSRFATRDHTVELGRPRADAERLNAAKRAFFTAPTEYIPTDGIVRDTARDIVKKERTDVGKARAIYEWVVENTFRDAKVRGCGWGDIKSMLETRNFGGKCGDLNAMFVGLARSVGVPARDVYGLRVARSEHGYASLGVGSPNVTRAQHCRAEFFAQGYGWVPVTRPTCARSCSRSRRASSRSATRRWWRRRERLRQLGDELAGLQHGPRYRVAAFERPQTSIPHVSERRDRGPAPGFARSGFVQVHDHGARSQGVIRLTLILALLIAAPAGAEVLKPWSGGATPALELDDLKSKASPRRLPRQGRTHQLLGDLVHCPPRGDAQHRTPACVAREPAVRRACRQLGRARNAHRQVPGSRSTRHHTPRSRREGGKGVTGKMLPATYIVGPDGVIRRHLGELDWSNAEVREAIVRLMKR